MNTYESTKVIILNGNFNKEEILRKLDVFLNFDRITTEICSNRVVGKKLRVFKLLKWIKWICSIFKANYITTLSYSTVVLWIYNKVIVNIGFIGVSLKITMSDNINYNIEEKNTDYCEIIGITRKDNTFIFIK